MTQAMNLVIIQIKDRAILISTCFVFRYPSDEESPVTIRMTDDVPIAILRCNIM